MIFSPQEPVYPAFHLHPEMCHTLVQCPISYGISLLQFCELLGQTSSGSPFVAGF